MKFRLFLILLLSVPVLAQPRAKTLQKKVETLVRSHQVGSPAVAIYYAPDKEWVEYQAGEAVPLASVFKVPVMLELCRQMQEGVSGLKLTSLLTLKAADKCIGSGSLQHQAAGTQHSVKQLIEWMETRSDNTATDMLFRQIGLESVDKWMASQGWNSSQIYLTNRAAWLISLGQSSDFRKLKPFDIALKWEKFNRSQRLAAAQKAERENVNLGLGQFQKMEDASADRNSSEENVRVANAVDNLCSAKNLAEMLASLYAGQLLNEEWTRYSLGVLGRQTFNTRIPRLLPKGTRVFHKTGTISGVVNDIGIIELPGKKPLVVVVLVSQVQEGSEDQAERLIAEIAKAAYQTYKP